MLLTVLLVSSFQLSFSEFDPVEVNVGSLLRQKKASQSFAMCLELAYWSSPGIGILEFFVGLKGGANAR